MPMSNTSSVEIVLTQPPTVLMHSTRNHKSPTYLHDFQTHFFASYVSFLASVHSFSEPQSFSQAKSHPYWQNAMKEELSALIKNQT